MGSAPSAPVEIKPSKTRKTEPARTAMLVGGLRDGQTTEVPLPKFSLCAPGAFEERTAVWYADEDRWGWSYPTEVYLLESDDPLVYRYSHTNPPHEGADSS